MATLVASGMAVTGEDLFELGVPDALAMMLTGQVFDLVMKAENPASLNQLVTKTGISVRLVEAAARTLVQRKLLLELPSTARHPKPRFTVNGDRYCAIGVKVLPERLISVVTDIRSNERYRPEVRLLKRRDPGAVVNAIEDVVSEVRGHPGKEIPGRLLGVGIELGGHIDGRLGVVVNSPNLRWRTPIDLRDRVRAATQVPVVVENDVNALALRQQMFRKGLEGEWLGVILIGDGIGSGLILDGRLARGVRGMAGEIGHAVVDPKSRRQCRCENRGCLESVASTVAIVRSARRKCKDVRTFAEVIERVDDGDPLLTPVLARAADALGRSVSILLNLLNLERLLIILPESFGDPSRAGWQTFESTAKDAMGRHCFSTASKDCDVVFERVIDVHGAQGAAAALVDRFSSRPLQWEPVRRRLAGAALVEAQGRVGGVRGAD